MYLNNHIKKNGQHSLHPPFLLVPGHGKEPIPETGEVRPTPAPFWVAVYLLQSNGALSPAVSAETRHRVPDAWWLKSVGFAPTRGQLNSSTLGLHRVLPVVFVAIMEDHGSQVLCRSRDMEKRLGC